MKKNWYINIEGNKEGPFSIFNLKRDSRINPDTLVWKEGFAKWKPMRDVPELREVFADDVKVMDQNLEADTRLTKTPQDELVLDFGDEPPDFFWIAIMVLILVYVTSQLFWLR